MCTIINIKEKPILLEHDLTVYKILQKNLYSSSAGFPYIPGKKYEQVVGILPAYKRWEMYDTLEYSKAMHYIFGNPKKIHDLGSIKEGFHFAFNKERLETKFLLNRKNKIHFLAEFTVPKGSLVYKGIDDSLGVSNCIILNVEQPYLTK